MASPEEVLTPEEFRSSLRLSKPAKSAWPCCRREERWVRASRRWLRVKTRKGEKGREPRLESGVAKSLAWPEFTSSGMWATAATLRQLERQPLQRHPRQQPDQHRHQHQPKKKKGDEDVSTDVTLKHFPQRNTPLLHTAQAPTNASDTRHTTHVWPSPADRGLFKDKPGWCAGGGRSDFPAWGTVP